MKQESWLNEICAKCGCTFGSHHGGTNPWPMNYCPGTEGGMDWDKGPGTVFCPTGRYKPERGSE
jgi:hypothetical protein